MAIIFTPDILNNPRKFLEHLNMLVREQAQVSGASGVATTDGGIVGGYEKMVAGAGMRFERELGVLKVTSTGISGASTGSGWARGYKKDVTGAGEATFDIADVGTSAYVIDGFNLTATGDKSVIVPKVPPLTDSRTGIQFKVDHYETGTIYVWLIPIDSVLGVTKSVVAAGVDTLTFTARANATYLVDGFILTAAGDKSVVVFRIPPLTDSRTLTSVEYEAFEAGTLYAWIISY